jgi:hypothetical protein
MSITKRYVHPQQGTLRDSIEKARNAHSGHTFGHTLENADKQPDAGIVTVN